MSGEMTFYDRAGRPISLDERAALQKRYEYCRVALTVFDLAGNEEPDAEAALDAIENYGMAGCFVSTVWTGGAATRFVFETIVWRDGIFSDATCHRSEADALAEHARAVDAAKRAIKRE